MNSAAHFVHVSRVRCRHTHILGQPRSAITGRVGTRGLALYYSVGTRAFSFRTIQDDRESRSGKRRGCSGGVPKDRRSERAAA